MKNVNKKFKIVTNTDALRETIFPRLFELGFKFPKANTLEMAKANYETWGDFNYSVVYPDSRSIDSYRTVQTTDGYECPTLTFEDLFDDKDLCGASLKTLRIGSTLFQISRDGFRIAESNPDAILPKSVLTALLVKLNDLQ